jgi:hypothetical protein
MPYTIELLPMFPSWLKKSKVLDIDDKAIVPGLTGTATLAD